MRQLRYEGPTLEAVLERILKEVGPQARIAKAERIRKGGIAGFFAKEHFAITLAAPGEDSSGSDVGTTLASLLGGPASKSPASKLEKGASVSRQPKPAGKAPVPRAPASPNAEPVTRSPGGSEALGNAFAKMAEETTDLVELSESSEPMVEKAPALSDGAFGSLLSEMIESLGADEDDGNEGLQAKEDTLPEDVFLPTPLEELAIDSYISPDPPVSPGPPLSPDPLEQPNEPVSTDATVSEASQAPVEERHQQQREKLCALGLPSHLLPDQFQEETPALDLLKSLSSLPRPPKPPSSAGSILVVVGDEARVLRTARQIASEMGLDPDAIPVASPSRLHKRIASRYLLKTSEAVTERLPSWRRRSHPTVVAVVVSMTSPHHSWARHVIEAMDATAVWGVVEATSKPADVAAWGRKLGGLDGLLVEDTLHTTTPADMLALDIPVVRIDGCHATPEQWTAILTARLEEVDAQEQSA